MNIYQFNNKIASTAMTHNYISYIAPTLKLRASHLYNGILNVFL